jgi:hypothetical protein
LTNADASESLRQQKIKQEVKTMASGRWERLAPLAGVVFVVLVLVAFIPLGGNTPDNDASAQKVQSFYSKHSDREAVAAYVLALSVPFLVFFTSIFYRAIRAAGGRGRLAAAAFGGGLLSAAGFAVAAAVHLALASAGDKASTLATTQTLNVLDNMDFIPFVAGLGTMLLAAGLATLRYGGVLPRWLGWAGVILGIAIFIPFVGFIAFGLSGIWILVASIVLYQRGPLPGSGPAVSSVQA